MVCVNEDAYLNELVTYWLKIKGYTCDWLSTKLVKILVEISQRILLVQPTFVGLSSQSELFTTTMKEQLPIRGAKITTISYTLFLPIKLVEVFVVVVSIHVEELEEHVTPKPIPLTIAQIGVGVEITLINTIMHAFKVLKILYTVLKDTLISEKLKPKLVPLVEPIDTTCDYKLIDTTCEKPVDDLTAHVEHVVFND